MAQATGATEGNTRTDLHDLDVKALTSKLVCWKDTEDMWTVVSTSEYTVGRVNGEFKCECKGSQFGHECYHIRRIKFELGLKSIPEWANKHAIDEMFREFIEPEM
jgi:hypothetical protein